MLSISLISVNSYDDWYAGGYFVPRDCHSFSLRASISVGVLSVTRFGKDRKD